MPLCLKYSYRDEHTMLANVRFQIQQLSRIEQPARVMGARLDLGWKEVLKPSGRGRCQV